MLSAIPHTAMMTGMTLMRKNPHRNKMYAQAKAKAKVITVANAVSAMNRSDRTSVYITSSDSGAAMASLEAMRYGLGG